MDHIPTPQCANAPIEIPYLCGEDFRYDATIPFEDYALGLDRLKDIPPGEHSDRTDEAALLLQRWLFFGMTTVFFGTANIKIGTDDFVRSGENCRPFITTRLLNQFLIRWMEDIKSLTSDARSTAAATIEACFRKAQVSIKYWGPASDPVLSRIVLSIVTLGTTLTFVQRNVFKAGGSCPVTGWKDPINSRGWAKSKLLVDRLVSNGWCPNEISHIYSGPFSATGLNFAASLHKPKGLRNHEHCSEKECSAIQVDESTYKTRHVEGQCHCEHLEAHHDKICPILHSGGIPLIQISRSESDDVRIEVVDYQPGLQYVAISHVWADGLGNVTDNSLPRCQLEHLQNLIQALYPESQSIYVWVDTLCVPVNRHAATCLRTVGTLTCRKVAIGRLKKAYEDANKVLVLDWELQQAQSSAIAEESLMRVSISAWMKRLWTYQEARLSKSLCIQFCDRAVRMEDMLFKLNVCDHQGLWAEIADSILGTRGIMQDFGESKRLGFLWNSLQNRSTSNAGDEAVCLALVLGLDATQILDVPDDKRMLKLYSMLAIVPSQLLFMPGPKIQEHGYGWAPTSFLSRHQWAPGTGLGDNLLHNTDVHTLNTACEPGYRADSGLLMRAPGFLLLASGEPLYPAVWLIDADKKVKGAAIHIQDKGAKSWNEINVQNLDNLGIVVDDHIPQGGAILAALVSNCKLERGIIFANFETRLWLGGSSGRDPLPSETTRFDEDSGLEKLTVTSVTEVKSDQMWCIG